MVILQCVLDRVGDWPFNAFILDTVTGGMCIKKHYYIIKCDIYIVHLIHRPVSACSLCASVPLVWAPRALSIGCGTLMEAIQ
jgi:hypothetical protein